VRQQEQDIQALRQKGPTAAPAPGPAAGGEASLETLKREIAAKNAEIQRVQQMLQQEREMSGHASSTQSSSEVALVSKRQENQRLNEQLVAATDKLQSTKQRYQDMVTEWQQTKQRLETGISAEGASSGAGASISELQDENVRLKAELQGRHQGLLGREYTVATVLLGCDSPRDVVLCNALDFALLWRDVAAQQKLRQGAAAIEDMMRHNEMNCKLIQPPLPVVPRGGCGTIVERQEIIPALDSLHAQLLTGAGYVPAN
ncbi:hypothetical protein T484DRAFT_1788145, partial [Baffinella frigidus]